MLLTIEDRANREALLSGTSSTPAQQQAHGDDLTSNAHPHLPARVQQRNWTRLLRASRRVEVSAVPLPASSLHASASARSRRALSSLSTPVDSTSPAAAAHTSAPHTVPVDLTAASTNLSASHSAKADAVNDTITSLYAPPPRSDALLLSLVTSSPTDTNHRPPSK